MTTATSLQTIFDTGLYCVLEKIFLHVHPPDLASCKLVNKEWYEYLKHHFWRNPRVYGLLMQRQSDLLETNRRLSNCIRKEFNLVLPDTVIVDDVSCAINSLGCLAVDRNWIMAGLRYSRVVVFNSITSDRRILDPPAEFFNYSFSLRLAISERNRLVVHYDHKKPNEVGRALFRVFDEDWIQQQTIEIDGYEPTRTNTWDSYISEKYLITNTNKVRVFKKQKDKYVHSVDIDHGPKTVQGFSANNDAVVMSFEGEDVIKIWSPETGDMIKSLNGLGYDDYDHLGNKLYLVGSKIAFFSQVETDNGRLAVAIVDWGTEMLETFTWETDVPGAMVMPIQMCLDKHGEVYVSFLEGDRDKYRHDYHVMQLKKKLTVLTESSPGSLNHKMFNHIFAITEMGAIVSSTEGFQIKVNDYWL